MTKILKEARIVMPGHDTPAHETMEQALVEAFGGFTAFGGEGGWKRPDGARQIEDVVVYDIAMEDTDANVDRLGQIALEAAGVLEQQAVYIRRPDGTVLILDVVEENAKRLGQKRVPQVGEVWDMRDGGSALVLAEDRDAGGRTYLNCAVLKSGNSSYQDRRVIATLADGQLYRGKKHPLDLVRFSHRF